MSFSYRRLGDPAADAVLIQLTQPRGLSEAEEEFSLIESLTGGGGFQLVAAAVDDWDRDLSPWEAEPFPDRIFGGGAERTLSRLEGELLPEILSGVRDPVVFLGGYSLAGLFALWAAYRTQRFAAVAAVSPSVWFPGFGTFARKHTIRTRAVYLSLGDKEEKAKNPVMASVGDELRSLYALLRRDGLPCRLGMNPGNHFREPALRMARGFAWLLDRRAGQLRRIGRYEAALDEAVRLLSRPELAESEVSALRENVKALAAYSAGEDWKQDFLDDEAGLLPGDLRRGVLSEDGIWNVLEDFRDRFGRIQ